MSWIFNGKPYKEIHNSIVKGFIYLITFTDPKDGKVYKYIGKKQFYATKTVKKSAKQLSLMTDKRGSKKNTIVKESDWIKYQSSNELLKRQDPKNLKKEILEFCDSLTCLTYKEVKAQFVHGVLESPEWLNANILGKFFNQPK